MNMYKKNGGFTLVELIVVIAILAILAGVAIPAYSGYIKSANDAAVETELTAISTAAMAANATAGQLTNIVVKADTTDTTKLSVVISGVTAKDFEKDFEIFYPAINGAVAEGTYTGTIEMMTSWTGSNYNTKSTTWTPSGAWGDPA